MTESTVWRRRNERFLDVNVIQRWPFWGWVRYGLGGMTVTGRTALHIINDLYYRDNILAAHVVMAVVFAFQMTTPGHMEGRNVLFNDTLNTFYLRLYGVGHMVKDHSDSERGNPLAPHGLLFPINSKGSFICTIPQTG